MMAGTPDQVYRNLAYSIDPERARFEPRNTTPYTPDSCYGAIAVCLREIGLEIVPHHSIKFFGIHPTDVTHAVLTDEDGDVVVDTFKKQGGFIADNEGGLLYVAPVKELRRNVNLRLISAKRVKWFHHQYFDDRKIMSNMKHIVTKAGPKQVTASEMLPVPAYADQELHALIKDYFSQKTNVEDVQVHELAASLGLPPAVLEKHIYEMFSSMIRELDAMATTEESV